MGNAELAIQLVLSLIDRAAAVTALLRTAQSEGRDISEAELDTLLDADSRAKAELDLEIARARKV